MTWDLFMYGAGIGCLLSMFVIAAVVFVEELYHRWPEIMTALRGNDRRGFVPLSSTALVLLLRTSVPKLRAVEAGAQPTHEAA